MKVYTYSFLMLSLLFSFSCNNENTEESESRDEPQTEKESLSFTSEQTENSGIETGKLTKRNFSNYLTCSGNIEPTPRSLALVNAPVDGFVKEVDHYIGDRVIQGETLAVLQNPELLKIQEDYLTTLSKYEFAREEYKRKAELNLENAASLKEEQKARSDLKVTEARLQSLKAQLEFLGMDTDKLSENGLTSTIKVKAPVTGYISGIHVNIGEFVETTQSLVEIVDPENLHLHLRIFEKDIARVKEGQKIRFSMLADHNKYHYAEVYSLGHSINPEDHTATVHARLMEKNEKFIPGVFVNAGIMTDAGEYYAIPEEGVVVGEDVSYIFVAEGNEYRRISVETGIQDSIFVSLINLPDNIQQANVVTRGAYFLNAAIESSDEE